MVSVQPETVSHFISTPSFDGSAVYRGAWSDPDGTVWSPRVRQEYAFRDWYPMYGRMVGDRFAAGLTFDIGAVTAEDDRVSVLVEVRATKNDGSEYHNFYHWYFEADGVRITGAREYNDTLYASQAFA